MPPQQRQGLADGIGEFFGFGPHGQPPEDLYDSQQNGIDTKRH